VELPPGVSVPDAVAAYRQNPEVVLAEPNYVRYASSNDPFFSDLWGLENTGQAHAVSNMTTTDLPGEPHADIDAPEAWGVAPTVPTTVIAVIDGGFDTGHEDLDGNLWANPLESVGVPGFDDDQNGRVDDVNGWNFAGNNATLSNTHTRSMRHGTHVAGTIAAEIDNMTGIAGVCPGCKLMLLRIARSDGAMTLSAELAALHYARAAGAKVVNLSLGGAFWSLAERKAIARAKSKFLAVVAAGNESLDNDMYLGQDRNGDGLADVFSPSYPASYTLPNIVSVAASNHRDEYGYGTRCHEIFGFPKPHCAFTNWGHDSVDLAAPGVDVVSSVPSGYATFDGTSMAAPHVAGIAGLVAWQNPTYTPAQIRAVLLRSADRPAPLGSLATRLFRQRQTGRFTRTSGRANAAAALGAVDATPFGPTDGNIDGARWIKTSMRGSVAWPADVNDVYKRKLYAGKRYVVRLNGPSGEDYDLYLWQRGTKEIWQTNEGCPMRQCPRASVGRTADESFTFTPSKTATYYLHVSAWLRSSGWYTVAVRRA
jgi:thermitase